MAVLAFLARSVSASCQGITAFLRILCTEDIWGVVFAFLGLPIRGGMGSDGLFKLGVCPFGRQELRSSGI